MQTTTPKRVFLSSTYADLESYRSAVMSVLQGFETVFKGMEHFGASENCPLEVCLNNLESADSVICLVGTRYGSCPEGKDKSYTQIEIEHAIKLKKPVLAYLLDEENQAVLPKFVDGGDQRERLELFKQLLRKDRTVETFTTPENLGFKVARDLAKSQPGFANEYKVRTYRECAYDALAEWYDLWYEGHWDNDEPCQTICSIVGSFLESRRGHVNGLKALDCACGTGNSLVALTRKGIEAYGTDGSREMLARAKKNCDSAKVPPERLISEPINWTDLEGYRRHFGNGDFDLIVNTANSLCHAPPTADYLGKTLRNFYALLKPGGLLVVDTKKYMRSDPVNGIPTYKELRYDGSSKEWIERFERIDKRKPKEYGEITFHSRLLYDTDPSVNPPVRRALIVITIYGEKLTPRTLVVPYYPLPASLLVDEMRRAGFIPTLFPAMEKLAANSKYDVVVGLKE